MVFGMTYYQICWFFCIYSFGGWVVEVAYHAIKQGKVVNRGFLNGPVCPVYGLGMLGVLATVNGLEAHAASLSLSGPRASGPLELLLLFVLGMLLATAVELFAGWVLDMLFHTRWWDYRDQPMNFRGYICLRFSVIWGLGVVFVLKVIHPMFSTGPVTFLPERYGWWVLLVLYIVYFIDVVVTVLIILGLNKRLKVLDEMRGNMRSVSDRLTDQIATRSISATQSLQEKQVQAALGKAQLRQAVQESKEEAARELEERKDAFRLAMEERQLQAALGKAELRQAVQESREEAIRELEERKEKLRLAMEAFYQEMDKKAGTRRLLKAFPDMRNRDYEETFGELREKLRERRAKGKR